MLKRILKAILIAPLVNGILFILVIGGFNYFQTQNATRLAIKELGNQIDTIQEEYNNLLNNDIELVKIIEENDRGFLETLKILIRYTEENIQKLSKKIEVERFIATSCFI